VQAIPVGAPIPKGATLAATPTVIMQAPQAVAAAK